MKDVIQLPVRATAAQDCRPAHTTTAEVIDADGHNVITIWCYHEGREVEVNAAAEYTVHALNNYGKAKTTWHALSKLWDKYAPRVEDAEVYGDFGLQTAMDEIDRAIIQLKEALFDDTPTMVDNAVNALEAA